MTVSGRINVTVGLLALFAGTVLTVSLSLSEYRAERQLLLRSIDAEILSKPLLPADIYLGDEQRLQAGLQSLLALSPAVRFGAILNTEGIAVTSRYESGLGRYGEEPFARVRGGASALDPSLTSLPFQEVPAEVSLLATLSGGERVMFSITPVFSPINPTDNTLQRSDFSMGMDQPGEVKSRYGIGYVQLAISRSILIATALPSVLWMVIANLVFVIVCVVLARLTTGRITRPLARLAEMAENIAEGTQSQPMNIGGSREIRHIASALNTMVGSISNYKTQSDVDQQLLRMKVSERTEQLSRRNQELNSAVKQVTEAKDRLRHMAYYDSLTSLPNRRLFSEQLNLLLRLAKRNNQTLALLFLDLDNFKRINDSLGHAAGDLLLKEVAVRLLSCVRDSDVVGHVDEREQRLDVSRLGGDEFTVILNDLEEPATAGLVAERLLQALLQPILLDGNEVVVTPSIGVAVAPRDGTSLEDLLKAADTAMYHAKNAGKSHYLYYHPDMDAAGVERLRLETELRKAIELGQLTFHYQPQVDSRTGNVVGVESLLRWLHPERGMIPPDLFIPLAEEIGLIPELGSWGLNEACRQVAALHDQGFNLPKVAVNVSALQFGAGFAAVVEGALLQSGLPATALSLELTEGIAIDNTELTLRTLSDLQQLGVRLSVDDFGTGYSSLSYLSRFPLDELKIDRSFVSGVQDNEQQASLVSAIIAMGQSLHLDLVAEGVETRDQYHFLTRSGAGVIQGYLFSPPVELEALKPMLAPGYFARQIIDIGGFVSEPAVRDESARRVLR